MIVTEWGEFRSVASPAVREAMATAAHRRRAQPARPGAGARGRVPVRVGRPARAAAEPQCDRGAPGRRRGHAAASAHRVAPEADAADREPARSWSTRSRTCAATASTASSSPAATCPTRSASTSATSSSTWSSLSRWARAAPSRFAAATLGETFVVCNGDVLTDLDLTALSPSTARAGDGDDRRCSRSTTLSRYGLVRTDRATARSRRSSRSRSRARPTSTRSTPAPT